MPRVGLQQNLLEQSAWAEAWAEAWGKRLRIALWSGALVGGEAKIQGKDRFRSGPIPRMHRVNDSQPRHELTLEAMCSISPVKSPN